MRIHLNNRERQYLLQKTTYVISGHNKHTSCIDPNEQGEIDWLAERHVPRSVYADPSSVSIASWLE
jgi:hypothetical protein